MKLSADQVQVILELFPEITKLRDNKVGTWESYPMTMEKSDDGAISVYVLIHGHDVLVAALCPVDAAGYIQHMCKHLSES
jgi:hypothetical protein